MSRQTSNLQQSRLELHLDFLGASKGPRILSKMPDGTILLTGASGLVGFRILEKLVDEGWQIRLAVRSEFKLSALKEGLKKAGKQASRIEHAVVPDMSKSGAFEDAIKGVKYVVHVASPLPGAATDDLEASLIKPAVSVTTGILQSILQSPEKSVKKVVITSSVAAVFPSEPKPFDADHTEPDPAGPYPDVFSAYAASKKLAYNATRKLIDEQKPYFDIINVMPTFVVGPNGFALTRKDYDESSNMFALASLLGRSMPGDSPGMACHVDDVAAVHVAALREDVTGHLNFGVNYNGANGGVDWNDASEIVKKRLPDLVGEHGFPLGGSVSSMKVPFDASKTERELGMKFKDLDTMIVDLARAYLHTKAA